MRFVDYGNCEKVRMKDVHPANLFGDVPVLSRKYALAHVAPTSSRSWHKDVVAYCKQSLTGEHRVLVATHAPDASGAESCEIYKSGDVNFAAHLVGLGFAEFE